MPRSRRAVARLIFVLSLVLIAAGPAPGSRGARANDAVATQMGNLVTMADGSIASIESAIQAKIDQINFRPLNEGLNGAVSIPEKLEAIDDIEKEMGEVAIGLLDYMTHYRFGPDGSPIPVLPKVTREHARPEGEGSMGLGAPQLQLGLKELRALYKALLQWRILRQAWAETYEQTTGHPYQTSAVDPALFGACEKEAFVFNSVPVSTLFSASAAPYLERQQAANPGVQLHQSGTQIAVLTDQQGVAVGEQQATGKKSFSLASSTSSDANVMSGNGVAFDAPQRVIFGTGAASEGGTTGSAEPTDWDWSGGINWKIDQDLWSSSWTGNIGYSKPAQDWIPEVDPQDAAFAYFPCKYFGSIIGGLGFNSLSEAGSDANAVFYDGGIGRAHAQCKQPTNLDQSQIQSDVGLEPYSIKGGFMYGVDVDAVQFQREWEGKLAENGIHVDSDSFDLSILTTGGQINYAIGEWLIKNVDFQGCSADFADLEIPGFDALVYRIDTPVAPSRLQLAAARAPAPEPRVQVAAKQDQSLPNDFYFHSKGHVGQGFDDQWALKRVGFQAVERDGKGSLWPQRATPVLVAVVDTGLDPSHPDIAGALFANPKEVPGNGKDDDGNGYVDDVFGWNFVDDSNNTWDNNGHGTFVSGIIAARSDDRIGIAGVNPWARILPVKVTDFDHMGDNFLLTQGIHYAVKMGARVINVSIGGKKLTAAERFAIDYANSEGALVVVAAGNDGIDVSDYSPAGIPGAITVAATGHDDERLNFSNFGAAVDIAAPGIDILSLRARQTDSLKFADKEYEPGANIIGEDQFYYTMSGTSFSAPFVSGVASLLFSINPMLKPEQVKRMILQSARDIDVAGFDWFSGYGLLDAAAAIKADPEFYVDAKITDVNLVEQNGQNFLMPSGLAAANQMKRAWLEVGQGKAPTQWAKASGDLTQAVADGPLGLIGLEHFTAGGDWTLKLVVEHENGRTREARYQLALE